MKKTICGTSVGINPTDTTHGDFFKNIETSTAEGKFVEAHIIGAKTPFSPIKELGKDF